MGTTTSPSTPSSALLVTLLEPLWPLHSSLNTQQALAHPRASAYTPLPPAVWIIPSSLNSKKEAQRCNDPQSPFSKSPARNCIFPIQTQAFLGGCALPNFHPTALLEPLPTSTGQSRLSTIQASVLPQWAPALACFGQSELLYWAFPHPISLAGAVLPSPGMAASLHLSGFGVVWGMCYVPGILVC